MVHLPTNRIVFGSIPKNPSNKKNMNMKKKWNEITQGKVRFLTQGMKTVALRGDLNSSLGQMDLSLVQKDLSKVLEILAIYFPGENLYNGDFGLNEADFVEGIVEAIVKKLDVVLLEIKSINNKGFVNSFDLNEDNFPITSRIVDSLLAKDDKGCFRKQFKNFTNSEKMEFSKWWYNIIMLDLYYIIEMLINNDKVKDGLCDDRLLELKDFAKELKSGLESYIRLGFKRNGITISENTYTGFDSEYQFKEGNNNELLSVQIAVCSRLVLKMGKPVDRYENKGVNTVNSQVFIKSEAKSFDFLDQNFIFDTIDNRIKDLRSLFFPGYDKAIRKLVDGLIKKVPSVVKGEFIYFMFPKQNLKTWFTTEVQDGISLLDIIKKSNEFTKEDLEEAVVNLYEELKLIFESDSAWEEEETNLKDLERVNIVRERENKEGEKAIEKTVFAVEEAEAEAEAAVAEAEADAEADSEETFVPEEKAPFYQKETFVPEEKEPFKLEEEELEGVEKERFNKDIFDNELFMEEDEMEFRKTEEILFNPGLYTSGKKYSRTYKQSFTGSKASVTRVKKNYLIAHLSVADLSMLKDFEVFKYKLDIVNKAMVTLKQPLLIDGVNVIVRDTTLLAPGGNKKLASLGEFYKIKKLNVGSNITRMKDFLKEDPILFREYALQDSRITLVHALFLEEFGFDLGIIGVPLSLSMLASAYLRKSWAEMGYGGYQINPEYFVNDSSKTQTPKGLFAVGEVGYSISNYIGNYKGGRNECFMYGADKDLKWYDYDLKSAYTTGMCLMGHPNYSRAGAVEIEDFLKLNNQQLLASYYIIKGTFKFPTSVKYPSIPCFADETTTVYPSNGKNAVLTGPEYVLAKEQGCEIKIDSVYNIPFKELGEKMDNMKDGYERFLRPFFNVIQELQRLRALYPKASIWNLLYKELANSIYGLIVKGISNKRKFDTMLNRTVRMEGNDLSNPILASWITAFIRSVIGELLHCVQELGGKVVSVTTDGFLTDLENLEEKVTNLPKGNTLFLLYKKARLELSKNTDDTGLELKKEGNSMLSWTTRGQFSPDGVIATTGFQRNLYTFKEVEKLLYEGFNTIEKEIIYLEHRLRSALDVFKQGGHVVSVYSDKKFRLLFDNKRRITDDSLEGENKYFGDVLFDSEPVADIYEALLYRSLSKKPIAKKYQKRLTEVKFKNRYKNVLDITVRNFIRCLLSNQLNLRAEAFENYADIADFVNSYDSRIKLTPNIIAQLKRRVAKPKILKRDAVANSFVEYIKLKFPNFDSVKFFNELNDLKV